MKKLVLLGSLLLTGCADSPTPILDCTAQGPITPDCRFRNPEDLARLPSGERILVSQMGAMDGAKPGNIVLYTPPDGDIEVLFPPASIADDRRWGSEDCPPPDEAAFSPHGIDLEQRADGRFVLLVVNHGLRESVEFVEVLQQGEAITLEWRGCALGPDDAAFNDVVARRDGGFWVTQMMPKASQTSAMLKAALFGSDSGFVYAWDPLGGYSQVPGSEGPFPNGLEKSSDETHLFINMYLGSEVRKLDLATGRVVGTAKVANPDNSTWARDGLLLVASHTGSVMELMACQSLERGSCGFAFEIVALDPGDMSGHVVAANRGAPMGGATVALEVGEVLYLGTFAGDRIARFSLGPATRF